MIGDVTVQKKNNDPHYCNRRSDWEQLAAHQATTIATLKSLEKNQDRMFETQDRIFDKLDTLSVKPKKVANNNGSKKIEYVLTALIVAIVYAIIELVKGG
jgi:hypothetical protein